MITTNKQSISQPIQRATHEAVIPCGSLVGKRKERTTNRLAEPPEEPDVYGMSLELEMTLIHLGARIIEKVAKMVVGIQALVRE